MGSVADDDGASSVASKGSNDGDENNADQPPPPAKDASPPPAAAAAAAASSPRSRTSSRSSSRSRSRSVSSRSRSRSVTRSRSRSSSLSSKSPLSSSSASSRSPSPAERQPPPPKMKLKVKIHNRKASKKLGDKIKESEEEEEDDKSGADDNDDDDSQPKRRGRKAKKASPVKRKKKSILSKEDGEVSQSDEDSNKEFDDGLDDQLIGDDEDRTRLEKMTEREREEELFKRAEIRENLRKRFEIQKKLKHQHKLNKKAGGGGDDKSDGGGDKDDEDMEDFDYAHMLDAKERSQDRRKNMDAIKFDKKSNALSELKARKEERERKEKERKAREMDNKGKKSKDGGDDGRGEKRSSRRRHSSSSSDSGSYRRRSSSSSSSSDRAASHSSGSDSDYNRKKESKKIRYVETQEDLEPIRLSRFKMERFVHLPIFKRLVTGCFVRIGIGQNPEGKSVYRCTEIVDVVETSKVYQMGKQRTNSGLKLKFGKQERVFRLEFISNSALMPSEFEKWKYTCQDLEMPMPTKDFVQAKADEIKKAINFQFSSADVDAMVEKKEKFMKNPVNYAMHKARLMKEKEIALSEGNDAKSEEIESKLNKLEQRAEELDRNRTANSSISAVSFINNRNRKNNVLKAEQAIAEEIKRKAEEGTETNPFIRRKCNPRMVTKKSELGLDNAELLRKMAEKENKEREDAAAEAVAVAAVLEKAEEDGGGDESAPAKKPKMTDKSNSKEDLFDAHDFDIEIDVDPTIGGGGGHSSSNNAASSSAHARSSPVAAAAETASSAPVPKSAAAAAASGPAKRSLNLSDYKKKRGLI